MTDPRLLAVYRRLAGRRDMNKRNVGPNVPFVEAWESAARVNAYQNAINDLLDAFQVIEDELRETDPLKRRRPL